MHIQRKLFLGQALLCGNMVSAQLTTFIYGSFKQFENIKLTHNVACHKAGGPQDQTSIVFEMAIL